MFYLFHFISHHVNNKSCGFECWNIFLETHAYVGTHLTHVSRLW